jgi:tetratricopeptide (TPR) repeat protein
VTAACVPRALAVATLAAVLGACATAAPPPPPPQPVTPPRVEAPPSTPAPPSARQRLAAPHNEASDRLERAGDLRRALDERKIALTIDPDDAQAKEARQRLEAQIQRGVAQRLEEGRAALARGAYVEARRRFLAALALDPTNAKAQEALRTEAPEMEVVNHTVRGAETLASIAQQYYGDSARAEVIADANNLAPNARLTAGRTIKVPEIPGVPFIPRFAGKWPPCPLASPAPPPATARGTRARAGSAACGSRPPPAPPPAPVNPLAGAEAARAQAVHGSPLRRGPILAQNPEARTAWAEEAGTLPNRQDQYDQKNYAAAYWA